MRTTVVNTPTSRTSGDPERRMVDLRTCLVSFCHTVCTLDVLPNSIARCCVGNVLRDM